MTIDEQLAVLEEVAGVIDENGLLVQREMCWTYFDEASGGYGSVPPEVALAIRLEQARQRIEAWCVKMDHGFKIDLNRITTEAVIVSIVGRSGGEFHGESYAHALAPAIKKLEGIDQ